MYSFGCFRSESDPPSGQQSNVLWNLLLLLQCLLQQLVVYSIMLSFPERVAELQLVHSQTTYKCSDKDNSSVNGFDQQFGVNRSMLRKNGLRYRELPCSVLFRVSKNAFNPPAEKSKFSGQLENLNMILMFVWRTVCHIGR